MIHASREIEGRDGGAVIWARELSAGYGADMVLKGLSLAIQAGEFAGFCGPNGAGKSTFLRLCLGMLRPAAGSIRVLGTEPWGGEGRRLRLRMAYVPQSTSGPTLPVTVREAVSMGLYGRLGFFRPMTRGQRNLVEQAMEACGVASLADKRVQELSGGQAQRTAIARALAMDAELLLFDEPGSNLDTEGRGDLLRIIQEKRKGRRLTVVIVSHDEDTLRACGVVYRFNEGRAAVDA
jgi:ABC-type Mn2+/Zn2+ transport system ATPase subunit